GLLRFRLLAHAVRDRPSNTQAYYAIFTGRLTRAGRSVSSFLSPLRRCGMVLAYAITSGSSTDSAPAPGVPAVREPLRRFRVLDAHGRKGDKEPLCDRPRITPAPERRTQC